MRHYHDWVAHYRTVRHAGKHAMAAEWACALSVFWHERGASEYHVQWRQLTCQHIEQVSWYA